MVMMNVEKISKEIIQPSSPTPHHLRTVNLSFLDQVAPPVWISIIVYYDAAQTQTQTPENTNHFERSRCLKKSLAETLTRFYPLAGTLNKDSSIIDCNDQGVEYLEAQVSCKLSEVVENSDVQIMFHFLPFHPHNTRISHESGLLAVQYNVFDCGGVAIGMCLSHQIADGTSAAMFLNAWATISRGASTDAISPSFDAAIHFPPRDISGFQLNPVDKIVTKRFVFNKSTLDSLKEQASSADDVGSQPTRVEVLSAFIWKRFMAVARLKPVKPKVFAALHPVNVREKLHPPLENCFGNVWIPAVAAPISPMEINEKDNYGFLVRQVGNAIRKINGDHVKKLFEGDQFLDSLKRAVELRSKGEMDFCNFTSWVRFPLYDVDFGWGKPTWATSPGRSFKNVVVFMRTRDGDGIEAWVNMKEKDMAMFESDPELRLFLSPAVGE